MINKKMYAVAAISAVLAFSSVFAITVFAENDSNNRDNNNHESGSMSGEKKSSIQPLESMLKKLENIDTKEFSFSSTQKEVPATITVNAHGGIRITNGKVTAVSGDIVTVEIWRLSFSIHKMADSKVTAQGRQITFGDIVTGDMVDVLGQLDTATSAFIHAQIISDRTHANAVNDQERTRLQSLIMELIKKLNAMLASHGQAPLVTPSLSPVSPPLETPIPSHSASPSPSASASSSPSASPLPSQSATPSPSPSPSTT